MRHKIKLSKFLIDRIHKDWIDRLFPERWTVDVGQCRKKKGGGGHHTPDVCI